MSILLTDMLSWEGRKWLEEESKGRNKVERKTGNRKNKGEKKERDEGRNKVKIAYWYPISFKWYDYICSLSLHLKIIFKKVYKSPLVENTFVNIIKYENIALYAVDAEWVFVEKLR